jgi:asparagine N-glycosylation enzyme membrane subunit Stt3
MTTQRAWWVAVGLALLCGLYFRVGMRQDFVFTVDGVNLQETDAYFHARMVEAFAKGGVPAPVMTDPYASYPEGQRVDVGPVLDLLVAGFVKVTGVDAYVAAAWCPVVLWVLVVGAVGLLGHKLFSMEVAAIAMILASTLPGHFMRVSSLGFHDHHVLEALLFVLVLYLMASGRAILAGVALGLYLLTFLGGAVLVAFLGIWRMLSMSAPAVWRTYAVAIVILIPFRKILWMEYTLASLCAVLLFELILLAVRKPALRWSIVGVGGVGAVVAAEYFGVFALARHFATSRGASTVSEMQWMSGKLTWQYFGPVIGFAFTGILQMAKTQDLFHRMLLVAGVGFAAMGVFQLRLNYYVAVAVALIAAYSIGELLKSFEDAGKRQMLLAGLAICLLTPNLWSAYRQQSLGSGVTADWREAFEWLRWKTPEPFGDPGRFDQLEPFEAQYRFPTSAYGVLAWWDYGYGITAIGHRMPFTNPTQRNAKLAAKMLMSQSEEELVTSMREKGLRYLMVGGELPMLPIGDVYRGKLTSVLTWAEVDKSKYYEELEEKDSLGIMRRVTLFYPAYFRSPAVRLALFGADEVTPNGGMCAVVKEGKTIKSKECFDTEEKLAEALKRQNALLASVTPLRSCVRLPKLESLRVVHQSRDMMAIIDGQRVASLRIYEDTGRR